MKGIVRMYGLYSPKIERQSHLSELFMKIFNKKKYYRYMRQLARQRLDERFIFKQIWGKGYTKEEITQTIEEIIKGDFLYDW